MSEETKREIKDPQLQLSGQIYGNCPIQAEGTVCGYRFYFRAKYDEWTLSVATNRDIDPVDICLPAQGFFRSGKHGKSFGFGPSAGWMPYDEVELIIRRCIDEFKRESDANNTPDGICQPADGSPKPSV